MSTFCILGPVSKDTIWHGNKKVQTSAGGVPTYSGLAAAHLQTKVEVRTRWSSVDDILFSKSFEKSSLTVKRLEGQHTISFDITYPDMTSGQRSLTISEQAEPFTIKDLQELSADLIYLGPLMTQDMDKAFIEAASRLAPLALDIQGLLRHNINSQVIEKDWLHKKPCLPLVTYLKAGIHEAQLLTGENRIEDCARRLLKWGAKEIILTCGEQGSLLASNEAIHKIPAFKPPQMKDTTGCGDTYLTGYLIKRLQGKSFQEAGRFAAALASLKIANWGPFKGTQKDVENHLSRAEPL